MHRSPRSVQYYSKYRRHWTWSRSGYGERTEERGMGNKPGGCQAQIALRPPNGEVLALRFKLVVDRERGTCQPETRRWDYATEDPAMRIPPHTANSTMCSPVLFRKNSNQSLSATPFRPLDNSLVLVMNNSRFRGASVTAA
jgi:hypothetical protein